MTSQEPVNAADAANQLDPLSRPRREATHEVRLLVTTIVVSVAALLLLARLRFPERRVPPAAAPPVLERLAARATYDELAGIIADVQSRVGSSLLAVALVEKSGGPLAADPAGPQPRQTLALRIDPQTAVAAVPAGMRVDRSLSSGVPVEILALDEVRGLAVLRLEEGTPAGARLESAARVSAPAYLAAAEPSGGGAALLPVFVSRADPVRSARWGADVYATGATVPPGTFVFSLTGEFAGLLVPREQGDSVLVPPRVVFDHVARMRREGSTRSAVLRFSVQPLTAPLAAALGADRGVVVSFVDESVVASGLRIGDVIQSVNGVATPDGGSFAVESGRAPAGEAVRLGLLRAGESLTLDVPTLAPDARVAPSPTLGLTLRSVRGMGIEVVAAAPGSAGARAGLDAGDIITHLDGEPVREARAIERAWATGSGALVVGARRGARPFVTAVTKPQ